MDQYTNFRDRPAMRRAVRLTFGAPAVDDPHWIPVEEERQSWYRGRNDGEIIVQLNDAAYCEGLRSRLEEEVRNVRCR